MRKKLNMFVTVDGLVQDTGIPLSSSQMFGNPLRVPAEEFLASFSYSNCIKQQPQRQLEIEPFSIVI